MDLRFKDLRKLEREVRAIKDKDWPDPAKRDRQLVNYLEGLAVTRTFAGDSVGALAAFDERQKLQLKYMKEDNPVKLPADLNTLKSGTPEDAIDAIVAAAKSRQIVMLNEAHHVPMHRAFAMQLARKLKSIGYTVLACETLRTNDMSPLKDAYVQEKSGYYSQEMLYADFLLESHATQWKLVSYEPNAEPRSFEMAKNLVDRIFKNDPKAKVFIYAGYGHIAKVPVSENASDHSRMAAQLKRLTGIDALTVDQTVMIPQFWSPNQEKLYQAALRTFHQKSPYVLKSKAGKYVTFGYPHGAIDLQVIHPAYPIDARTKRAVWMSQLAGLQPKEIPAAFMPAAGSRMIYAYRAQDPEDAMPVDVVTVEAGHAAPSMMLPPGAMRYRYED